MTCVSVFVYVCVILHMLPLHTTKYICVLYKKGNKSVPLQARGAQFQEVKVPRFRDNGTGWW